MFFILIVQYPIFYGSKTAKEREREIKEGGGEGGRIIESFFFLKKENLNFHKNLHKLLLINGIIQGNWCQLFTKRDLWHSSRLVLSKQ